VLYSVKKPAVEASGAKFLWQVITLLEKILSRMLLDYAELKTITPFTCYRYLEQHEYTGN